jgi:hypothetical protein
MHRAHAKSYLIVVVAAATLLSFLVACNQSNVSGPDLSNSIVKKPSDLLTAVNKGEAEKVDELIKAGADPTFSKDGMDSPLTMAARKVKQSNPFASDWSNVQHIFITLAAGERQKRPQLQLEGPIELTTEMQGVQSSGIQLIPHLFVGSADGRHEIILSPPETHVKGVDLVGDAFQIKLGSRYRVLCSQYNGLCEVDYLEDIGQSRDRGKIISIPSGDYFPSTNSILNKLR